MMRYQKLLLLLGFAFTFALGTGVGRVLAQQPAPAAPPPPPPPPIVAPPPYVPPDYHDVLSGKAPLRVLAVSRQKMLAWKSDAEVKVTAVGEQAELATTKPAELCGIVLSPEDHGFSLRKEGKNFQPVTKAIRLTSEKPISLWTPTPDAWTSYATALVITPLADGTFSVAREMPLDEYLRHVVPAEMPASFHQQALRAQAIIARTYALCKLGRHAEEGADICTSEHCQVCGKDSKLSAAADDAIKATSGMVLLIGDKLAEPYYHSTCGGATDDASYLWGPENARPYLAGTSDLARAKTDAPLSIADLLAATDSYCKDAPNSRWTKTFTIEEINALVGKNLPAVTNDPTAQIRHISKLAVEERTAHGRVASLRVEGDGASILVRGDKIRWLFGNGTPGPVGLWSTLFDLAETRDATGALTGYTLHGAGRGHGLGLCQWGANGRARAGQDFREIIRSYYPGTKLSDEK